MRIRHTNEYLLYLRGSATHDHRTPHPGAPAPADPGPPAGGGRPGLRRAGLPRRHARRGGRRRRLHQGRRLLQLQEQRRSLPRPAQGQLRPGDGSTPSRPSMLPTSARSPFRLRRLDPRRDPPAGGNFGRPLPGVLALRRAQPAAREQLTRLEDENVRRHRRDHRGRTEAIRPSEPLDSAERIARIIGVLFHGIGLLRRPPTRGRRRCAPRDGDLLDLAGGSASRQPEGSPPGQDTSSGMLCDDRGRSRRDRPSPRALRLARRPRGYGKPGHRSRSGAHRCERAGEPAPRRWCSSCPRASSASSGTTNRSASWDGRSTAGPRSSSASPGARRRGRLRYRPRHRRHHDVLVIIGLALFIAIGLNPISTSSIGRGRCTGIGRRHRHRSASSS